MNHKQLNIALKGSLSNIRHRIIEEREDVSPEKLSFVLPTSSPENIKDLEKPLVKTVKNNYYSVERDMQSGKLQREIDQYKKMINTLNPSKNLTVNTNPINGALS